MRFAIAVFLLVLGGLPAAAAQRTAKLSVPGMTCPLCPITVTTAIEKLDGIVSVTTDMTAKTATVVFDDSKATPAVIAEASANAGYPASIVSGQ